MDTTTPDTVDKKQKQLSALEQHIEQHDSWYNTEAFFARLKRDWPEPPEQLHSGGWEITKDMASYVEKELQKSNPKAFDLCCGEGATANYLAKERGWDVTGLDVNPYAIERARTRATQDVGSQPLPGRRKGSLDFIVCSAYNMDAVPDATFDVVYGQDPDALDSPERLRVFKHVFRILKPGGMFTFHHHWIPGFNWSAEDLESYWSREKTLALSADLYVFGLEEAGFEVRVKDDITFLASSHLRACFARNQQRIKKEGPEVADKWLERTIHDLDQGKTFGLRVVAYKPANV